MAMLQNYEDHRDFYPDVAEKIMSLGVMVVINGCLR